MNFYKDSCIWVEAWNVAHQIFYPQFNQTVITIAERVTDSTDFSHKSFLLRNKYIFNTIT